jgi:hypothetical protein
MTSLPSSVVATGEGLGSGLRAAVGVLVQVGAGIGDEVAVGEAVYAGVCVALDVGESVGQTVAVLLPALDTAATGIVGWSVWVGGAVGDGLTTGLGVRTVAAGTVSGNPATAGPTPQPVRMPSDTTSNRVAVRTGLPPLSGLSAAAADHSWNLFTLLGSPHLLEFLTKTVSRNLDTHTGQNPLCSQPTFASAV